ncbi:hypothetical protein GA0070616_4392 [Micromonospora nigra]|uniref:Uncharacterized protein n=1 Tax=Micromonospora nigra TaxID=145857 RepID=A0A1C6SRN8_9ACTN|nr:hypothetical protein [Micromonospora nigra]SCL32127.1 hypothetical protein GA0070616_4392 [Micromonospora nigra]
MSERPDRLLRQLVGERFGPPVDERRPTTTRDRDAAVPTRAGGVARPHRGDR